MSLWQQQVPTESSVELPPDPRALESLGRNHSLPTALADLVDNSIDAGATQVLIRFVQQQADLIGLYVVDNGRGIEPDTIDAAMTVGARRDYATGDLGHFGLGLKAASFSQASSLTVLARAAGHPAVGRRWLVGGGRRTFRCDIVPADFAARELERSWPIPAASTGTVVRWDQVRGFPATGNRGHTDEFVSRTISALQGHLGLMFHRLLADDRVCLYVDVEDVDAGPGILSQVRPINPFAYPNAPSGWPRTLTTHTGTTDLSLHCHIWPGRSSLPEYRLPGGAESRQGLYFYRRGRLLHAGGWEGIHAPDKKLQLARVAVDIDGDIAGLLDMNPEKSRVSAGPDFARVVSKAQAPDGTTINDYLQAAERIWTQTNQRATAQRKAVFPPGKGIHPNVGREIRDELPQFDDEPLNIMWKHIPGDDLLEIDRTTRTVWLNQTYRRALLGGRRGGLNDLPLIKALLFLLTEHVFQGSYLGARDKDQIDLWQEILTAAAKAEKFTYEARK
ncbi:ATP-binding protein [Luedemannella helvata]|uniref:ATP-binding protein n=1 Tax=Luedemannella helvata TaxID=349315 RepID=A0ABN2L3Z0_9ACTN